MLFRSPPSHPHLFRLSQGSLSPPGVSSVRVFSSSLEPGQEPGWLSSRSLEAFVSYYWLYGLWWSLIGERRAGGESQGTDGPRSLAETRNGSATPERQNGEEEEKVEVLAVKQNGLAEPEVCESSTPGACVPSQRPQQQEEAEGRCRAACGLLLSEPHAMHQASQRAIAEIQLRLASMVHQHSRAQETEPPAGEGQPSPPSSSTTTTQEATHPDSQESTAATLW